MQSPKDGVRESVSTEVDDRSAVLDVGDNPTLFDVSLDGAVNRFKEKYRDFEAVRKFLEEMRNWHDCLFNALKRFQEQPDLDPAEYLFDDYLAGIEDSCWKLNDAILEAGLEPLTFSDLGVSS